MKSFIMIGFYSFIPLTYRRTLREIKNSGAGQIILDCRYENLRTVLKQAQVLYFIIIHHLTFYDRLSE